MVMAEHARRACMDVFVSMGYTPESGCLDGEDFLDFHAGNVAHALIGDEEVTATVTNGEFCFCGTDFCNNQPLNDDGGIGNDDESSSEE